MSRKRGTINIFEVLSNATKDVKGKEQIKQEDTLRMNIALVMVKIRKEMGMSQEEVARKLGVTQSWVSRLENASYDHQIESIWRYLKVLGAEMRLDIALPEKRMYISVSDRGKPKEYKLESFRFRTGDTYIFSGQNKRGSQNKEHYNLNSVNRGVSRYTFSVA